MMSKLTLHNKHFAQFLNQMINCSPVFSAAMTLCHPRSPLRPHVSLSLNRAFVSQLLSFCPSMPTCVSSHDDITSDLIEVSASKVRALTGSYSPSLSPYHSITPLCWRGLWAYMDSNETGHFVICQHCSNITHTEQTL